MLDVSDTPAKALLQWYDRHARALPWRALPGAKVDPYAVWLSEIMLQQTGVKTVGPYYQRFLARWPNVAALAAADIEQVMREWAGLGYYSRARSLHACAMRVVAEHGGAFPANETALLALPGIGPYTAAAIAAIAFGQRAVVVDGNIERVVTRLFAIETPLPQAKPLVWARTDDLTPEHRAGDFAQAMMDLGSTICTPTRPVCVFCPLRDGCAAQKLGTQESFPRKAAKPVRPLRLGLVWFLRRADGMVLMRRRPPRGLLGGMTEFPGTEWAEQFDPRQAISSLNLPETYWEVRGTVKHIFTHFALTLTVCTSKVQATCSAPEGCFWVQETELDSLALPTLMHKVWDVARETT